MNAGPAQLDTLRTVAHSGGTFTGKGRLSRLVGPHGSSGYGYWTIQRCLVNGWLTASYDSQGRTVYTLTDSGKSQLSC